MTPSAPVICGIFVSGGASSAKTFEELLEQQLKLDEVSASCFLSV